MAFMLCDSKLKVMDVLWREGDKTDPLGNQSRSQKQMERHAGGRLTWGR